MKKFLSIISALVVALTLSISAFATKNTKEDAEKAIMEYFSKDSSEFDLACYYYFIQHFLNSSEYTNSDYPNKDLSNPYTQRKLAEYCDEYESNNSESISIRKKMFPNIDFSELSNITSIEDKDNGIYRFKNEKTKVTYTIKKINNKWIMTDDTTGKIVSSISAFPSKYNYLYPEENSSSQTDSSSSKTESKATTSSGNDEQAVARPDTSQVTADIAPEQKPETSSTNTEQPENSVNEQPVLKIDEPDKPTTNMTVNSPDSSSDVSDNSEQEEDENDSNIAPWIIIGTILAGAVVLGVIIIKKKK